MVLGVIFKKCINVKDLTCRFQQYEGLGSPTLKPDSLVVNGKILQLQKVISQEDTSPSSREPVAHGNYKTHTFWVLQQHTLGLQDSCMCKHDITSRLSAAVLPNANQPSELYFP